MDIRQTTIKWILKDTICTGVAYNEPMRSTLICLMIIGYPLPDVIVSKGFPEYEILIGKNSVMTFKDFYNNKFSIDPNVASQFDSQLSNLKFEDLTDKMESSFIYRNIPFYHIDNSCDEDRLHYALNVFSSSPQVVDASEPKSSTVLRPKKSFNIDKLRFTKLQWDDSEEVMSASLSVQGKKLANVSFNVTSHNFELDWLHENRKGSVFKQIDHWLSEKGIAIPPSDDDMIRLFFIKILDTSNH